MSIISGVTVNWKLSPRIITIPSPIVEVTLEDLNDTLQDIEDSEEGICYPKLRDASGKQDLGGTPPVYVGLTIALFNSRIKFADRSSWIVCNVSGGNLVAVDQNGITIFPIEPASYVNAIIAQSSSATIISGDAVTIADEVISRGVLLEDNYLQLK